MKIRINLVFLLFLISWGNAAKRGLSGKHGNRGLAHFETQPLTQPLTVKIDTFGLKTGTYGSIPGRFSIFCKQIFISSVSQKRSWSREQISLQNANLSESTTRLFKGRNIFQFYRRSQDGFQIRRSLRIMPSSLRFPDAIFFLAFTLPLTQEA